MHLTAFRAAPLLLALVGVSAAARTRALDDSFWIDEGLTAGIASRSALDIPELLRLDGSPPLYYFLLNGWTSLFGDGDAAVRSLSLVFALAVIPVAFWAARELFDLRAAWIAAAVAAAHPFLTFYAQEARMYTLVALLSLVAASAYVLAFARGRREHVWTLAVALTLLLYTHYWALFLAAGAAAALPLLRPRPRDALIAFGLPALAFAPWIPTLLFQAENTGAPWSNDPPLSALAAAVALVVAAIAMRRDRALAALALMAGVALGAAWTAASFEPMWATRYAAVLVGPLLLGAAALAARARAVGVGAAVAVCAIWLAFSAREEKSNVEAVAAAAGPALRAGDLVLSPQPEQVPTLRRYLPPGLRYASPLGAHTDPTLMDWRDALDRLRRGESLEEQLVELQPGASVVLVVPVVDDAERWRAPWTRLVRARTLEWSQALDADRRFELVLRAPESIPDTARTAVRATVYRRVA